MDKITKARTVYLYGMILLNIAGYVMMTCGCLLFKLSQHFPVTPLAVAAVLFIIYNVCALRLYISLVRNHKNSLVKFYLVNKVTRMIYAFIIIVATWAMVKNGFVPFVICFFVLYIITIIYESVFFVQIEKKINEKQV